MHWAIPTSARFAFRDLFLWRRSFLIKILTILLHKPPTHLQLMHYPRTCEPTGFQQPVHSAPYSLFSCKKAQAIHVSPSYAQSKAQMDHPQIILWLLHGGCFKCYTYCNMALGWLKKKKKVNNSDFQPFQVCHFKVAPIHIANTTAGWGKLYKWLNVFLNASICFPAMILNTLIGATISYGYAIANPYLACSK